MTDHPELHDGSLYLTNDPDLVYQQQQALELLYDFNQTRPHETARRQQLLAQMFAALGKDCYVEPPLHANWGGRFVHFGDGVYANFNLTLVDDTHIFVGAHTMFGPNVTIATTGHPIDPPLRQHGYQYSAPVHIGNNCWLGAGVTVLSGVTIGANTVVGAGSIVTHDLPANVIAYGDPCKVARPISEHDREYYFKQRKIDSGRA
ncbi:MULTISPECIES: sugar O-acetyltransferase [unclassified Lacticaseibacillus]|uniref:sugar O-acetyltransferase n=1 Tax=unclassified Lacticaseibacillus TaxID=2759744 RepID=UPI00194320D0|nr:MULTISPECIES: sugar O-acetyltransferase [unclassified Lacticaseibacillus]